MLVTKLAEQALRPKRIDSLTLPMATFGGPLIAGVRPISTLTRENDSNTIGISLQVKFAFRPNNNSV